MTSKATTNPPAQNVSDAAPPGETDPAAASEPAGDGFDARAVELLLEQSSATGEQLGQMRHALKLLGALIKHQAPTFMSQLQDPAQRFIAAVEEL